MLSVGRNRGGGPRIGKYTMKVLSLRKREHLLIQTLKVSKSIWVNGFERHIQLTWSQKRLAEISQVLSAQMRLAVR